MQSWDEALHPRGRRHRRGRQCIKPTQMVARLPLLWMMWKRALVTAASRLQVAKA
eukprot:COSAG06_NODE_53334_length_300_cov_1.427861_2_plen_54_part_01